MMSRPGKESNHPTTSKQQSPQSARNVPPPPSPPPEDRQKTSTSNQLHANIVTISKYLDDTGIEANFNNMLHSLLALPELPYNPYPGFVKRFKSYVEKFHMDQKSEEEIYNMLVSIVEPSNLPYIFHPNNCDYVWGLRNVVELAEQKSLKQFLWLFESLSQEIKWADRRHGYSTQVMLALVGPSVFEGILFKYPGTLHIRMEYLITGPETSEAIDIFTSSIVADILHTEQDEKHIFIGVNIPVKSQKDTDTWHIEFWNYKKITEQKDTFWHLVSDAVTEKLYVHCQVLFRMDPDGFQYRMGEKQYALNFIQVSHTGEEKGLSYFTEYPLVTLHEGVFLRYSDAESYLATFIPRVHLSDINPEHFAEKSRKRKGKKASRQSTGKIQLDGFVMGDRPGYTPEAKEITSPIKSSWQGLIASLDPQTELFDIIQCVILLIQMDKEAYDERLMIEVYHVLHSTAARLHTLMNLNQTIRRLILKKQGEEKDDDSELITNMFMEYKIRLVELFDSPLHKRSSDQVLCIRVVSKKLDDILMVEGQHSHQVPLTKQTVQLMKNLNSYLFTLYLGLLEDVLAHCPALKELITTIKKNFPTDEKKPNTPSSKSSTPGQSSASIPSEGHDYKHGREDDRIVEHQNQVINVKLCKKKIESRAGLEVESVLLKYITDTHLDEVWSSFLVDLVVSGTLSPNPYPQLVTALRQATVRMDLQFETSDKLTQELMNSTIKNEDPINFVYHLPGCDAHGLKTAMTLLDQGAFFDLAPVVAKFIQKEFMMRQGPYRIAICSAVSGFTTLYGKMDPYLHEIELHEHCYIRGPEGCWGEATEIYSKIVYAHIKSLFQEHSYFLVGFYFGNNDKMWSIEDLMDRRKGFASEFEACCNHRRNAYLKLYVQVGWRLIPVCKYFKLHFLNDKETRYEVLFPENPAHLYQNVFLEKDRAAFHFQYGGSPDMSDPYNSSNLRHVNYAINEQILNASDHQDWFNVYRWLLLRNIISQGSLLVPEVWRMLHSVARKIEYTNCLIDSLAELIRYALNVKNRLKDEELIHRVITLVDEEKVIQRLNLTLGNMVKACRENIAAIYKTPSSLMPRALLGVIQKKLQSITEKQPNSHKVYIIVSMESIFTLEEVKQMLRAVQDAIGYDVHSTCPESQAMLHSIQIEQTSHPERVSSAELKDYHHYLKKPAAQITEHVHYWSSF